MPQKALSMRKIKEVLHLRYDLGLLRTFGNDWEGLDWKYTLTRRAGLSSGGLPNKTGNEEEKASPRRSTS
jgi:hypothetical protein